MTDVSYPRIPIRGGFPFSTLADVQMKRFFFLLLLVVGNAFAAFPASPQVSTGNFGSPITGDLNTVCAAAFAIVSPSFTTTVNEWVAYSDTSCHFWYRDPSNMSWNDGGGMGIGPTGATLCPSYAVQSGSSCTCKAGYDQSGSACVVHVTSLSDVCTKLNASGAPLVGGSGVPSLSVIVNGVKVTGQGAAGGIKNGVNTGFEIYGPFTCSSAAGFTPGDSSADSGAAMTPVAGGPSTCSGSWGSASTVNGGAPTCFPSVPSISGGTPGAAAGPSSTDASGASTSASTSCDGVNCTTTTTTTTPGTGGAAPSVSTSTKSEPQPDYCTAHPSAVMCNAPVDPCKGSTAVGCAELGTVTAPDFSTGDSGFSNIGSVMFASSPSCPAPIIVNFMGRTIALRYDDTCDVLDRFVKPIVLVLAAGAAAFLFAAGFKV